MLSGRPVVLLITQGLRLRILLSNFCEGQPLPVQPFDWARSVKMAAGVKTGMSPGIIAAQNRGFALSATAAASMAPTKQIRTAILSAQERSGNIRMRVSPRTDRI